MNLKNKLNKLILKNDIMNFENEMASNISHSLIITLCELKLSFKSVSKFLLCLIVFM